MSRKLGCPRIHAGEDVTVGTLVSAGALFDPTRKYRYTLYREYEDGHGRCAFIMLNPSTADETEDDPSVRRCIGFARKWGFRVVQILNLFAIRGTDPEILYRDPAPIGPDNDLWISKIACGADRVICAWGVHGAWTQRGRKVARMLQGAVRLYCLGTTKEYHPRHPLYLSSKCEPREYAPA